jgi:hypothetical protein
MNEGLPPALDVETVAKAHLRLQVTCSGRAAWPWACVPQA